VRQYWIQMLRVYRLFLISFLVVSFSYAGDTFEVSDFGATLFSKFSKKPVQIETSMIFEGRDVDVYDFKIVDALNIVIGSFYAEDLLTSKGKEALKKGIIKYTSDKYGVDIDNIYIRKFTLIQNVTAKALIKELDKEGYIKK